MRDLCTQFYFRSSVVSQRLLNSNNIFPPAAPATKSNVDVTDACGIRCGDGGLRICENQREFKGLNRPFCIFHNKYLTDNNFREKQKAKIKKGYKLTRDEEERMIVWRVMELLMFSFALFVTLEKESADYNTSKTRNEFHGHEKYISNSIVIDDVAQELRDTGCFKTDVNVGMMVLAMWNGRMRPAMVMNKMEGTLTVNFFGYPDKVQIQETSTVNLTNNTLSVLPLIKWLTLVASLEAVVFIEVPGQLFNKTILQAVSSRIVNEEVMVNVTDVYPYQKEKSLSTYLHVPSTVTSFPLADLHTILMQPASVQAVAMILRASGEEWEHCETEPQRGTNVIKNILLTDALEAGKYTFTLEEWKLINHMLSDDRMTPSTLSSSYFTEVDVGFGTVFNEVTNKLENLHRDDVVITNKGVFKPKQNHPEQLWTLKSNDIDVPFLTHEHAEIMIDTTKEPIQTQRMRIELDISTLKPELTKFEFMYYNFREFRFFYPLTKIPKSLNELDQIYNSRRDGNSKSTLIYFSIDVLDDSFEYRSVEDRTVYNLLEPPLGDRDESLMYRLDDETNVKVKTLLQDLRKMQTTESISVLHRLIEEYKNEPDYETKIQHARKRLQTLVLKKIQTTESISDLHRLIEEYKNKPDYETQIQRVQKKLDNIKIQRLSRNLKKTLSKGTNIRLYVGYTRPLEKKSTIAIRKYVHSILSSIVEGTEDEDGGETLRWMLSGQINNHLNPIAIAAKLCSLVDPKTNHLEMTHVFLGKSEKTILEVELSGESGRFDPGIKGHIFHKKYKVLPDLEYFNVDKSIYDFFLQKLSEGNALIHKFASQIAAGFLKNR